MAITLGSNIASLQAGRRLTQSSDQLSRTFERLSSGQRINRASDDAAGLAIASALNASSRVYAQGIRNLNDGLSLLSIADGGVEQLSSITIRISELIEQAANGTYSHVQRKALDVEAQALSKEFSRIVQSTQFNGVSLFNGQLSTLRLQGGYGVDGGVEAGIGGAIGTGTFGAAVSYSTESAQSADITIGDVNNDGILDLVTTGWTDAANDGYATIRLGLGDGTFGAATSYAAESQFSYASALADVNGDGALDLVTAGRDDNNYGLATIRLGQGDGIFGSAVSYATESFSSRALSLGDLNGDGMLDLVTAGYSVGPTDSYATVRLGKGDGSFDAATSYATVVSGISTGLALGDLNGDGVLDIIASGRTQTPDGYVTVLLGLGDGTFATGTSYAGESHTSWAVTVGDVNGDGALDLVTAGYTDSSNGYATVRLGRGDGTFNTGSSYAMEGNFSYAVALDDLNGDSFLDLVTAGASAGDGYASVRLGQGDGSFGGVTSYRVESNISVGVAVRDLNGDGVVDLASAGRADGTDGFATVRLASTRHGIQSLLPFSLKTRADALQALPIIQRKREQLSAQRGEIGAFQARIATAIRNLESSRENFVAAEGRIKDADTAIEAAQLARLGILQQAASAVMAQANQQPALALQLLR